MHHLVRTARTAVASAGAMALLTTGGFVAAVVVGGSADADPGNVRVNGGLFVRSGPSTDHRVIGGLPDGSAIDTTGPEKNGFYPISFAGKTGWIAGRYIDTEGIGTPDAIGPSQGEAYSMAEVYVRSGPTIHHRAVGMLFTGERVELTGEASGAYSEISWSGGTGWSATEYLAQRWGQSAESDTDEEDVDESDDDGESGAEDSGTEDTDTGESGTEDSGSDDSGNDDSGTEDSGTEDSGTDDSGEVSPIDSDGTLTPEPQPSTTPEPTNTPSQEPSPEASATPTKAPNVEPTLSPSLTPDPAPTRSPAPKPSLTPSATPSPTPSQTPSATPSPTPSATPSARPTESPTPTQTPKPTQAPTPKPTPTKEPEPEIPEVIGHRYATTALDIRTSSGSDSRTVAEVPRGTRLGITGVERNGRAQIIYRDAVRWVTAQYLSRDEPREEPPRNPNKITLPGLTADANRYLADVQDAFPEVRTIYGKRVDPGSDHHVGRAIDMMLPNYKSNRALGDRIAAWTRQNASKYNVHYVVWKQQIWNVQRDREGWRNMPDRGSDTQNHFDHVHISFNAPRAGTASAASSNNSSGQTSTRQTSTNNSTTPATETCKASYYSSGSVTASGERYDPSGVTAAHRSLPFGTRVEVTNKANGKSVTVRINDRGPFIDGRCLDLSQGAFEKIANTSAGVIDVEWRKV